MKRRGFIKYGGTALIGSAVLGAHCHSDRVIEAPSPGFPLPYPALIQQLVEFNDNYVREWKDRQLLDATQPWYGGIHNAQKVVNPVTTGGVFRQMACSYVSPSSGFYQSEVLEKHLQLAIDYLLHMQHPDGTVDFYATNFHSTPDTGFLVMRLAPVYRLLSQMEGGTAATIADTLLQFLIRAGEALSIGGIHTPNHRWVVCAALAWLHRLSPNKKYVNRIDQWLDEGIDIDPDGQYHEKSAYTYSPICDLTLILIARLLEREALFAPVRKNLEMTLYFAHSNGEVVTEASGRQDKYQIGYFEHYYYPYRYMAIKDQNGQFAAMCRMIEQDNLHQLHPYLNFLLEDELVHLPLPTIQPLPANYEKIFAHSHLVRIRRAETDASILAGNATFFSFYKGTAVLQAVRLASAFFGAGQFEGKAIESSGGSYFLRWSLSKPYYQTFPPDQLPDDGDWNKMPRDKRPLSEVQTLTKELRFTERDGQFEIDIHITGTNNVPVALELAFRHGGQLSGVRKLDHADDRYLLESGMGTYRYGDQSISFGPGKAVHEWTQLRGAVDKLDAMSVYLTGYTPFRHTLKIS